MVFDMVLLQFNCPVVYTISINLAAMIVLVIIVTHLNFNSNSI